jgi:hypothetical protein
MISEAELNDEIVTKLFTDTGFALESLFKIETESQGIQPFLLNDTQRHYNEHKTFRDVILKPRRRGFSTFILAWALWETITHEGWTTMILVHKPFAVNVLWTSLKVMCDNLPEWVRPKVGRNNLTMLTFPELGSSISIMNAGEERSTADALGRSGKINFLHCSEFAFWMWPELVLTAAGPCVPSPPNGTIIIETTANGYNYFQKLWKSSKLGQENFTPHFYSWLDGDTYKMPLLPGEKEVLLSEKHPDRLSEEEKFLMGTYNLELERIKWRRFKIKEVGRSKFPQEYPLNDSECFLRSGRPFFDSHTIESMKESPHRKPPLKRWKNGEAIPDRWRVFSYPVPGRKYVAGVDCAEGLEHGDNDSIAISDWETGEEVAHIWGKFGTDGVTRHLLHVIELFPKILIGIENSKHGQTVLSNLLTYEKVPRRLIYHHTDWDEKRKKSSLKPGWDTNPKSRPVMLDDWKQALEMGHARVHDRDVLDEHLTFTVGKDGKPQAQTGACDDTVISKAIGWQMRKYRPITIRGFKA